MLEIVSDVKYPWLIILFYCNLITDGFIIWSLVTNTKIPKVIYDFGTKKKSKSSSSLGFSGKGIHLKNIVVAASAFFCVYTIKVKKKWLFCSGCPAAIQWLIFNLWSFFSLLFPLPKKTHMKKNCQSRLLIIFLDHFIFFFARKDWIQKIMW